MNPNKQRSCSKSCGNGGDFPHRFETGLRVATGSALLFGLLIGIEQQMFPSIWLGNVFFLAAIAPRTLGGTALFIKDCIREMIFVVLLSWGVALACTSFGSMVFHILLPWVVGALTFFIMLCPWISLKNIMLVLMIVVLCDIDVESLYPLRMMGTSFFGVMTALVCLLLPLPRPVSANNEFDKLNVQVLENTSNLLLGGRSYSLNAGQSAEDAHHAQSVIELSAERLSISSNKLYSYANPAEYERTLICRNDSKGLLPRWADFISAQQEQVNLIRSAVLNSILGENLAYSPDVREAKNKLGTFMHHSVRELVLEATAAMELSARYLKRSTKPRKREKEQLQQKLRLAMDEFDKAWDTILPEIEATILSYEHSSAPSFAFLVQRLTLGFAIQSYCSNVSTFLEEINTQEPPPSTNCCKKIRNFLFQPWPRWTLKNLRLPIKLSIAMTLASLFVAVPNLEKRSEPFSTWPAATVAVVSLGTTGSSYVKCMDRLWATVLASSYALLVVFLLHESHLQAHYVKIPSIALFTFVAYYLENPEHPYVSMCASFTMGNILYGSVANDYDIPGYVTDRIVLVFIGILIFMLVEFTIFPLSLRERVQQHCFAFFARTKFFLENLKHSVDAMSVHHPDTPDGNGANLLETEATAVVEEWNEERNHETDFNLRKSDIASCDADNHCSERQWQPLKTKQDAAMQLSILNQCLTQVGKSVTKANQELGSALTEPSFGFSVTLDRSSFTELVREQTECKKQMDLLVDTIKSMQEFRINDLQDDRFFQYEKWPDFYSNIINIIVEELDNCCEKLSMAFPDGKIRPQQQNCIHAMGASAAFRNFQDVRLTALSMWSEDYRIHLKCSTDIETNGYRPRDIKKIVKLGLAADSLLEICRHLELAGAALERTVWKYPQLLSASVDVLCLKTFLALSSRAPLRKVAHDKE